MKKKWAFRFLFLVFVLGTNSLFAQETTVAILPTIHRLHLKNPHYSYEDVHQLIKNFKPDIIGLEIRPEDLAQDSSYLKQFYPPEMIQVKYSFPNVRKVGVDYYGEEVRGRLIELEVFRDSTTELGKFKLLERKIGADSALQKQRIKEGISRLQEHQVTMLSNLDANELMDGRYDRNIAEYYSKLSALLTRFGYSWYDIFNTQRDKVISENIRQLITENRGKRIIILLGASHRHRAVQVVRSMPAVKLMEKL